MKNAFVLDLNVIPHAWLGKNEHDTVDYSSAFLILNIIENCHKIIVNNYLLRKYAEKLDEMKTLHEGAKVLNIINVIHQAMTKFGKVKFDTDELNIHFPPQSFHDDDVPVVTPAARNHAILVTCDDRLIRKLRENNITQSFEMKVLRPEDAIQYAQATNTD
jgi:hypothetical protein